MIPGSANPLLLAPAAGGYQVQRSLRFNSSDSAFCSRTPAVAGSRTTWTWAAWVKRTKLGGFSPLFSAGAASSADTLIYFDSGSVGAQDSINWFDRTNPTKTAVRVTTQVFRDVSAWYHFVFVWDSNNGTAGDRMKIYVNGIQITTFSSTTNPSPAATSALNNNVSHAIGSDSPSTGYFDGYLADIHFISGQALDATAFTEVSATTGQLIPKAYSGGSYGTNGFYLQFADNSSNTAATLGKDTSGNGNNWTPNNFSVYQAAVTITTAKIYSVYNGGARAANYSVEYSDNNSSWSVAFTGVMSTTACGLVTGSGTGNGSYGAHRYWRYVVGSSVISHHPNMARLVLGTGSVDYNIIVFTADNCADSGSFGGPGTIYSYYFSDAGNDSLVDTPTSYGTDTGVGGEVRGNYATLNPLSSTAMTLSNGNLDCSTGTDNSGASGTVRVSTGKWFFEATTGSAAGSWVGWMDDSYAKDDNDWAFATGRSVYSSGGLNGNGGSYAATYTTNDVIGCALDLDNGTVAFYKNGVSQGTMWTGLTGTNYRPFCSRRGYTFNFGQRAFAYTAPSGFKALCDTNLPAPVIAKPNTVMDVVKYDGNGSTQTISGLGFSPDLVWVKSRSSAYDNILFDTVRTATKQLISNSTGAEATYANSLTAFNSNGFSVGSDAAINNNASTYVAWTWDAGGTTDPSNTAGSITSQVRANVSAGFSVVTFNSGASNGDFTVGHGLGVVPRMIIMKSRTRNGGPWWVYHASTTTDTTKYLELSTTGATITNSGGNIWGSALPTSTLFGFSVGAGKAHTQNEDIVSYCFTPVVGYSSFGSYTGNGSTDGPFVYTGFRPRWVMIKRTDAGGENWRIVDTARGPYNVFGVEELYPNSSAAENSPGTVNFIDALSNGFKLRNTSSGVNASGGTYIYISFAESPFAYARAR